VIFRNGGKDLNVDMVKHPRPPESSPVQVFKVTSQVLDSRETDRNNENLWLAMTLAFTSVAE
jgi:hypothetical protein